MKSGFTLVEIVVAVGIFAIVMVAVAAFEVNTFIYGNSISASYQTAQNAQIILKTLLTELRESEPGANGSYALITTGTSSMSFFADTDNNGAAEQVTYSLIGTTLYRARIAPSGNPPSYSVGNQSTSTLMVGIRNSTSTPVFQYFDTAYTGTSSALTQPVTATAVRLIKVSLTLDFDPNRSPTPITYTVQASMRNVKSNL